MPKKQNNLEIRIENEKKKDNSEYLLYSTNLDENYVKIMKNIGKIKQKYEEIRLQVKNSKYIKKIQKLKKQYE